MHYNCHHLIQALLCILILSYTSASLSPSTVALSKHNIVEKRSTCDDKLVLCSPVANQTWYHYDVYDFVWNQNNTLFIKNNVSRLDLHIVTLLPRQKGPERRSIKSWFNLPTSDNFMSIQVTDDWFPITLANNATSNYTWTFYAFLLDHDAVSTIDPTNLDVTSDSKNQKRSGDSKKSNDTAADMASTFVQFNVVQSKDAHVIIRNVSDSNNSSSYNSRNVYENNSNDNHLEPWMIALIVVVSIIVLAAIVVFFWKCRRRNHRTNNRDIAEIRSSVYGKTENNSLPTIPTVLNGDYNNNRDESEKVNYMQNSILSAPDAMMIANTFRQALSTSPDSKRKEIGEDLLRRQLELDKRMAISEVERRTSSVKKKRSRAIFGSYI